MTVVTLLAADASALDVLDDTEMTGTYRDVRIDAWGNITVPSDGRLELVNVTLVFHKVPGDVGITARTGSTLIIADGDDDPATTDDGTNVTSDGSSWFFFSQVMSRFELRNSNLTGLGGLPSGQSGRMALLVASSMSISGSWFELSGSNLLVRCPQVEIEGSYLCSNGARRIEIESNTTRISGCQLMTFQWLDLDSDQRVSLERSSFKEVGVYSRAKTFIVSESMFRAGCLYIYSQDYHLGSSLNMLDSSFEGNYQFFDVGSVDVQRCNFAGGSAGIRGRDAERLSIGDCDFNDLAGGGGIDFEDCGDVDIGDVTYVDCPPIRVDGLRGTMEVHGITVKDCPAGMLIRGSFYPQVSVSNGSFIGINLTAIETEGTYTFQVRGCEFIDCTRALDISTAANPKDAGVVVDACVFQGCLDEVTCVNGDLRMTGCTLVDERTGRGFSTAVDFTNTGRFRNSVVYVKNVSIVGKGTAMSIASMGLSSVNLQIKDVSVEDAIWGILVEGQSNCFLEGSSLNVSAVGLQVNDTNVLNVADTEVISLNNGMNVTNCTDVTISDVRFGYIGGWAILQDQIRTGTWSVTRPTVYTDRMFRTSGRLVVSSGLELVKSRIEFVGSETGKDGIVVENGGTLRLTRSVLLGDPRSPVSFIVRGNSTLEAAGSRVINFGSDDADVRRTGLCLEGGEHEMVNVRIEGPENALVLMGSNVTLHGCELTAGTALVAVHADIEMNGTVLEGATVLNVTSSSARLWNTSLNRGRTAVLSVKSTVRIDSCRISVEDALVDSDSSHIWFWRTQIASSEDLQGTVSWGTVALYDTGFEGEWAVDGKGSEVTDNWHMNVSASFRWNGEPAAGFEVRVYQEQGSGGFVHSGKLDGMGHMEMFWLTVRRWTRQQEERLYPHLVSIEHGEFRASSPLPDDTWGDVALEVRDVVGPVIHVDEPANGTVRTNKTVTLMGTVLDRGSGVVLLQYSHNGEIWEELEITNGTSWCIILETVQGSNTVRIRGRDADGSTTVEEIGMFIDSYPPMAMFVSPEPMTATKETHIVLSGLMVLDEGTPISRCTVNGVEVESNGSGGFELAVEMTKEGENTFELLIVDKAGNAGRSSLTLVRDSTPPVLTVQPLGPYSRETYLILQGWIHDRLETVLTVNGRYGATVTEGPFSVNVTLAIGPNPIIIEAVDALGNTARSEHLVIQDGLINGSIVSPVQGAVVEGRTVTIGVLTDPMAWARVNGHTDWVRADNESLDLEIVLEEQGEHTIEVVFRDDANNTARSTVTITYVKPTEEKGWSRPVVVAASCAIVIAVGSLAVLAVRRRVRKPI